MQASRFYLLLLVWEECFGVGDVDQILLLLLQAACFFFVFFSFLLSLDESGSEWSVLRRLRVERRKEICSWDRQWTDFKKSFAEEENGDRWR